MEELSKRFPYDLQTSQYFTMVYAVVDLERGTLTYASAGHEPLIVVGSGRQPELGRSTGQPIALVPSTLMKSTYEERSIAVGSGDRIYLYSDGIPESWAGEASAGDPREEPFGSERIRAVAGETRRCGARTLPLGQTEVQHPQPSLTVDHDVARLQIPMQHADGVDRHQRPGHLVEEIERQIVGGKAPTRLPRRIGPGRAGREARDQCRGEVRGEIGQRIAEVCEQSSRDKRSEHWRKHVEQPPRQRNRDEPVQPQVGLHIDRKSVV